MLEALASHAAVEAVGRMLLHSIWQGLAIAMILAFSLWLVDTAKARLRYSLATAALLACLVLPIVSQGLVPATRPAPIQARTSGTTSNPTSLPSLAEALPTSNLDSAQVQRASRGDLAVRSELTRPVRLRARIEPFMPAFVAVWLLGVVVLSLRMALGVRGTILLRTRFTTAVPDAVTYATARLARATGMARTVTVRASRIVDVPMVVGITKPVILLPTAALTGMPARQLEMLIAHELAHVRRLDHLAILVQSVTEILLFFNPAAWWISNQVRQERECACDRLAVRALGGDRVGYGRALARLDALSPDYS